MALENIWEKQRRQTDSEWCLAFKMYLEGFLCA